MKRTLGGQKPPLSRSVPGPPHLRYYAEHNFVAWQPQGVLDDRLLDDIADWLLVIEKVSLPFNRFVDFSQLSEIAVRTRHVFNIAERRRQEFSGSTRIRTALFCDDWVGYGIACLYQSLMEESKIEAHAFRERSAAAQWLGVPAEILALADEPAPHR